MKDYSITGTEEKTFILGYNIIGNQIVVRLASGDTYPVPYTKENEESILKVMEKQVTEAGSKQNDRLKKSILGALVSTVTTAYLLTAVFITNDADFIYSFFASLSCFNLSTDIYRIIDSIANKKDIEKHMFFIRELKEKLEKKRFKLNQELKPSLVANTSKNTQELAKSSPVDSPILNINSVDKVKYKELRQILQNIKMIEAFNINYPNSEVKEDSTNVEEAPYSYKNTNPEQNYPV